MPWNSDDRKTIWSWLNLPREMLLPNSDLAVAMLRVEEFDTQYQTDLVRDAQDVLERLSELKESIGEERVKVKVKKTTSYLEGDEEYFAGDELLQSLFVERDELIQKLRQILAMDSLMSCFGMGDLIESS